MSEHFEHSLFVALHDVSAESDNRLHYELDETSLKLYLIFTILFSGEFLVFSIIEVITPEFFNHLRVLNVEFLRINFGKSSQGEGPTEESRSECNSTFNWANLLSFFSHIFTFIS